MNGKYFSGMLFKRRKMWYALDIAEKGAMYMKSPKVREGKITLFDLFFTFFKLGLFTFGGGYAMIANIRDIVLEKKRWLTEDELVQVITIAESTPGPIAINLATYVGYNKRGALGSACATVGVVLPSFVIILLISKVLDFFMENPYVAGAFDGIKCAVAFLIIRAGWGMMKKLEKKPLPIIVLCLTIGVMLTFELLAMELSTVVLILAGGILGIVAYGWLGRKEAE
jgi:chromate transporter